MCWGAAVKSRCFFDKMGTFMLFWKIVMQIKVM